MKRVVKRPPTEEEANKLGWYYRVPVLKTQDVASARRLAKMVIEAKGREPRTPLEAGIQFLRGVVTSARNAIAGKNVAEEKSVYDEMLAITDVDIRGSAAAYNEYAGGELVGRDRAVFIAEKIMTGYFDIAKPPTS